MRISHKEAQDAQEETEVLHGGVSQPVSLLKSASICVICGSPLSLVIRVYPCSSVVFPSSSLAFLAVQSSVVPSLFLFLGVLGGSIRDSSASLWLIFFLLASAPPRLRVTMYAKKTCTQKRLAKMVC